MLNCVSSRNSSADRQLLELLHPGDIAALQVNEQKSAVEAVVASTPLFTLESVTPNNPGIKGGDSREY